MNPYVLIFKGANRMFPNISKKVLPSFHRVHTAWYYFPHFKPSEPSHRPGTEFSFFKSKLTFVGGDTSIATGQLSLWTRRVPVS